MNRFIGIRVTLLQDRNFLLLYLELSRQLLCPIPCLAAFLHRDTMLAHKLFLFVVPQGAIDVLLYRVHCFFLSFAYRCCTSLLSPSSRESHHSSDVTTESCNM